MRIAIITLALVSGLPESGEAQEKKSSLKERFEKLDAAGDHAGVVALWRANPFGTLYVIDSYLEGSLKLEEESSTPDPDAVRALHARAMRGARAADEAFARPIFTDYASSFVGWTFEQKKRFRAGQAAFGRARQASKVKDYPKAAKEAETCIALARPLGDWWGTAMGLSALGEAKFHLARYEEALTAHAEARLLHHGLGLGGAEYRNLKSMASLLEGRGRA